VIEIRSLTSLDELRDAVRMQQQVWGFSDADLIPLRVFVVASKVGGQVFGAFEGGRMVGFCMAFAGIKPGPVPYLHSQMLAVLPEYRNHRIGQRLKLAQREEALGRGVKLMEWTFDPLELKNAYLNIEKLGCVIRRYALDQYGVTSSALHTGMPTDRCYPEWWLDHPRVLAVLAGNPAPRPDIAARIEVPNEIQELRRADVARAREIQQRVSAQFVEYFGKGLAVVGFERGDRCGTYLLGPWDSR
jgi:predicted GNAT superfamily acetyltransferase